jgi:Bacterial Ig-like domain
VFLGNDHGTGSSLIPHQMGPDNVAPAVLKVYPSEAKQPLTSRITIFFTEDLDLDTVIPANIVVRTVAGAVVPGVFSKSSFNAISFGPKAPLAANTTYEVSVPAGGVTDLVGNKITVASTVRFSTGATIDTTGVSVDGGAGAGGGTSAGGSTSVAGATAAGGAPGVAGGSSAAGSTSVGGSAGGSTSVGDSGGSATTSAGSGNVSGSAPAASAGAAPVGGGAGSAANSGSCSCSMPGAPTPASGWAVTVAAACIGLGRLRGRGRRRGGAKTA